jgi:hypothetical protein
MTQVDSSVLAQVDTFFSEAAPVVPIERGPPVRSQQPERRHSDLVLVVSGILAAILGGLAGRSKAIDSFWRKLTRKTGSAMSINISREGRVQHLHDLTGWSEQIRDVIDARLEKLEQHITDKTEATDQGVLLIPAKVVESLRPALESFIEQTLQKKPPVPLPTVLARQSAADPPRSVADEVGSAFVEWCRSARGNVHRIAVFSEALGNRVNGADVRVLSRDRDTNEITFVSDGAGDPVEYWMVTVGGASMLLPRPLNQESFKELDPVYEGKADPQSLRSIEPALIRQDGASWVLEASGRVN